ncbi:hypothetical protein DJ73_14900 [Halorubrum sp. Ea1]|uniref:hypothetical protein n=1 Tax=Halorubrum sp. Ea1 TaxID=1480718 RepID=UPI000B99ABDF|nr:hypothetical protein [Halorubrum sp. Ea1]OYR50889.1 hypothetical protein DJ73_14900 [Halorubrum sp. Ea1]
MKLNRRSVLGAIGMIGVGTGAAFGSGAFTTVEAQRAVEVNVLGNDFGDDGVVQLNDGDLSDEPAGNIDGTAVSTIEDNIANTILGNDGTADVLVNTASSNVTVKADDTEYDGRSLFPVFDDTYGTTVDRNYVSLVANDVTIVFGPTDEPGRKLPPNATLTESSLFGVVRNGTVDVTFNKGDTDNGLLTNVDDTNVSTGAGTPGGNVTLPGTVETGEPGSTETEDLIITIGSSGSS